LITMFKERELTSCSKNRRFNIKAFKKK